MMSYSQIIERAEHAKRARKVPVFISGLGEDALRRARIPFIGTRTPRGFERLHVARTFGDHFGIGTANHEFLFVDSSGFGTRGELAMTFAQFAEFVQRHPGHAYAVVEAGQFQVVVGVYRLKITNSRHDDGQGIEPYRSTRG